MDAGEGLRRIAATVRWIGYGIAGIGIVYAIGEAQRLPLPTDLPFIEFIVLATFGVAFAAPMWVLAWIIEGFAKGKGESS